jgi:hypothetical protein
MTLIRRYVMDPKNKENESYVSTALWTGGALALAAGLAVYMGMQG